LFSLGCIYENWADRTTGEIRNTFSILTTPANPMMEKIHYLKKRMPLILKKEDEALWIDPNLKNDKIKALIKPYDESDMIAYTISQKVNSVQSDRNIPEIIERVEKKEIPNIKTALKEIEDEVIFDEIEEYPEINLNGNEYSSPYDLAEKIFGLINNYKKEYDDIDLDFIKNTLEIVNENLNERVKI